MCGQCNNPNDNYFCGDCSQGLECIVKQQEGIDDGMLKRRCQKKEGRYYFSKMKEIEYYRFKISIESTKIKTKIKAI